jgi:superoxide dismutase, Fe-Mn family
MKTEAKKINNFPFSLEPLPYNKDALEPHMSAQTLDIHHGKHHNAYVQKLNALIADTDFAKKSLEEIILATYKNEKNAAIFNNAAQVWNHSFFWHSMSPNKTNYSSNLLSEISQSFGGYDDFIKSFKEIGLSQFGSGWIWLVFDPQSHLLKIEKTSNAVTPLTEKALPLIACDVWEHAYYLDYKNDRARYLDIFLEHLINWEFADKNLKSFVKK